MSKTIEELLAPKPEARPRIYAYSIDDKPHAGLLKVGQTTRDVKQRVAEQLKTANIKNYKIELDEPAERDDGTTFTDHEVRAALVKKKFANPELEWMRCTVKDLKAVLIALRTGQKIEGTRDQNFSMRAEQRAAVEKTHAYFHSIWKEDMHAVPHFLWNAKMRFGKTFTTYQLARKLGAKRVLVVTFKPAVEDAWQTDIESHVDFDGWQYMSRNSTPLPSLSSPSEGEERVAAGRERSGRSSRGERDASESDSRENLRQQAAGLFRFVPRFAGPRRCWKHQGQERMASTGIPYLGELGVKPSYFRANGRLFAGTALRVLDWFT